MKFNQWMIFCFVFVSILFTLNCVLAQETALMREFLDARKERGVETDEQLKNNFVELFGGNEYKKKTGYLFLTRALGDFPPPSSKMDLLGDYRLTPEIQNFCYVKTWLYLNENYISNLETAIPRRFILGNNAFLSDMLYWEWETDGIQFRKQETGSGMLLSLIPKELDVKKGIGCQELKDLLLKVTKIPSDEVSKMLHKSPSVLKEGTVFSNVENLHELVEAKELTIELQDKFPFPREPGEWSRQLVGFISKDAICLIIMHEVPIYQVPSDPLIVCGSSRWLSGRILQKDGVTPVLPHGVTEIPERWKPVLEDNARMEQLRLKQEEDQRIEEAKWRVWHDKNGKPIFNGEKMKFDYWDRRPIDIANNRVRGVAELYYPVSSYRNGTVTLLWQRVDELNITHTLFFDFPLSQFCDEDKKQIMAIPPKKWTPPPETGIVLPVEGDTPKTEKPKEKDDIE